MALDVVERELGIPLRLRRALGEIVECIRTHKIVVLEHAFDALSDDSGREQLGQRGGDRFEQRLLAYEMDIGIDRKAGRWQKSAQRHDIVAIEPDAVGELEPARDAAFVGRFAVVVVEAAAPLAPQLLIIAARDQVGVLLRDLGLVVVAVERPGLHLPLGALAAVQEMVKRMAAVIAPRADVAQARFQLGFTEQVGHSTISCPSSATSQPWLVTWARSGEPSTRMGLVLLMWM